MAQLLEMLIPAQEVNGDRVPSRRIVTLPIIASQEMDRSVRFYLHLPTFLLEEGLEDKGTDIYACYRAEDGVLNLNWVEEDTYKNANIIVTAARIISKYPDF